MSKPSRREAWTPPPRPEWVARFNAEGAGLDLEAVVPLDPESLVAHACANTGLSDFGGDDWREPLAVLCRSLNAEAALNLVGRLMTRSDLLMFLEARLRVEDLYRRHPEIEDEEIAAPIWIMGQGRTGTSMLQTLLALDPGNRTFTIQDAYFPVHEGSSDAERHAKAEHRIQMWNRVTPEVMAVHDFAAHEPIETIMAESLSFRQPAWLNLLGLSPGFTGYIASHGGMRPPLAYGKRVFKLLQWQTPVKGIQNAQWIFKSPDAIRYLPDLLAVYPDVRLVWTHRDPVRTLSSAVNMIGTLTWIRSDRKVSEGMFDAITDPAAAAVSLTQPIDWIEGGALPKEQLCNLMYQDLIAEPLETIQSLYDYYGMTFTPEARAAIAGHLAAHPRSSRPAHRYSVGEAEQVSEERAVFARYEAYFRVPREG